MPNFYSNLDVYSCMSILEGVNNSILEAGAMGIPVISTRCGASKEIIVDGYNGFLVERTKNDLENKLIFLRDNLEKRKEMGKKGREMVERNWTWEKNIPSWDLFFQKALSLIKLN